MVSGLAFFRPEFPSPMPAHQRPSTVSNFGGHGPIGVLPAGTAARCLVSSVTAAPYSLKRSYPSSLVTCPACTIILGCSIYPIRESCAPGIFVLGLLIELIKRCPRSVASLGPAGRSHWIPSSYFAQLCDFLSAVSGQSTAFSLGYRQVRPAVIARAGEELDRARWGETSGSTRTARRRRRGGSECVHRGHDRNGKAACDQSS